MKLQEISERETRRDSEGQKRQRIIKRLEVVEAFRTSGNKPEWMILDVVPVIPPELRPMVQLDGGRFATADLNDLYRRVINRNNPLKRMLEMAAPDIIVATKSACCRRPWTPSSTTAAAVRPVTGAGGRQLKSLSTCCAASRAASARTCWASASTTPAFGHRRRPAAEALSVRPAQGDGVELFKPFVIERLVNQGMAVNVKTAKRAVERVRPEVWDVLEGVIKDHPVMLNRAPTLHRLGIQAFEPVLVEGKALKLHPLCCTAFNADFDGDQMAVHVPLSMRRRRGPLPDALGQQYLEAAGRKPVVSPTQDMVCGCYYLTIIRPGAKGEGKYFTDVDEALMAYATGELSLQAKCHIRLPACGRARNTQGGGDHHWPRDLQPGHPAGHGHQAA